MDIPRNKGGHKKLGIIEKLSYASGGAGFCVFFMGVGGYLLYVYTDIIGINAVTAANIFLLTRFWDAIDDPVMGALVDFRPFARFGKGGVYRPWILLSIPLLMISFIGCFTVPSFVSTESGKVIWCVLFYVFYTCAQSVGQVPFGTMSNAITTDTEERGLLGSYRNFGENIGNVIVSISILPMVNLFSKNGTNMAGGYSKAVAVLSVIAAVLIFIGWKNLKERGVVVEKGVGEKFKFIEALKMLGKNRPAICLVFALLLAAILVNFRFAYIMYYMQIYVGADSGVITTMNTVQTVAAVVSFWVINFMFKKMEKRTMLLLCGVLFVANGAVFLIGGQNIPAIMLGSVLFGFLMSLSFSTVWGTIPDCVEYGLWKTGVSAPAFLFAAVTFAQKCGIGLASWLAAMSLNLIGYVKGAEITESI